MISKPQSGWDREDPSVEAARHLAGAAAGALSAGVSGLARVRAMYRAAVCGFMAVMLGLFAVSAGLTVRTLPVALGAGAGSLLLGWLAVRSVRTAFGRIGVRHDDVRPDLDVASFGRRQEPPAKQSWAAAEPTAAMSGGAMSGGAMTISYDRTKLFLRAAATFAGFAVLTVLFVRGLHVHDMQIGASHIAATRLAGSVRSHVFLVLMMVAACYYLWRTGAFLFRAVGDDLTAIAWDNQQIRIRSLTSSRQVPWQAVESFHTKHRVLRVAGIRAWTSRRPSTLVFRVRENGSARTMNVPASALTMRPELASDLARRLAFRNAQAAGTSAQFGDQTGFGRRRMAA